MARLRVATCSQTMTDPRVPSEERAARHILDEGYVIERLKNRFLDLASKVTREAIESYLSDRLKVVGPARHNLDLQVIRAIFRKGAEWGFCQRSPAEGIKRLKEPPGRLRFLTEDEREKLLAACTPRIRQIVEPALDTGLRRGELLSLKWENVDLRNRMIRVERSKNGERRDVPMSERVFEVLQALPRRVDSPCLFANPDGTAPESVSTAWHNALKRSGIANLRFHDLPYLRLESHHGMRRHPDGADSPRSQADRDDGALFAPHPRHT